MRGDTKMRQQVFAWIPLMTVLMVMIMFSTTVGLPATFGSTSREKNENEYKEILNFSVEPPEILEFSNTTGAQIECKVHGKSRPTIIWKSSEGLPIKNVLGLRHITTDGTLVFEPFKAEDYRQDVHAVSYRCSVTNSLGTILSKDVKIKAVIVQPYDVYVYDTYVIRGNDAVIKCHFPNFLVNYINVTSWLRDDRYIINNTDFNDDNKYVVLPEGELLIRNTDEDDHGSTYKCKTFHSLSKTFKMSTTKGTLFVTAPQTNLAPRVIVSKTIVKVVEGETLVLPCIAQGTPLPEVKWVRKLGRELISLDQYVYSDAMIIESIQHTQAGQYRCVVKNAIGEETVTTDVIVDVPLSVEIIPSKTKSELDRSVTLTCEASGKPIDSIYWLKNGEKILLDGDIIVNDKSLTIARMKANHGGIYQCFVANKRETVHAEAILQLGDLPPDLLEVFSEQTINEGDTLSLRCRTSGTPLPKITWTLDNDELRDNIQSQSLSDGSIISWMNITSVHNKDGGVYTCKATNTAGNTHHMAKINIYGPLSARSESKVLGVAGEKILFNCPVFGYPVNTFKWYKDEQMLPVSERQLIWENGTFLLKDLQKNIDGGRYICIAENNRKEKATGKVQLSVLVPPKIVPFSFQEDLIREGMRARIQCVVSEGDLPLTIEWTKDNEPLHGQMGVTIRDLDEFSSILTISSVSPRYNGEYTCSASNGAATTRFSARLSVNVPPKIIGFFFQDDQFFKGMRAHIICAVSQGDLPIEFVWVKDGQSIPSELGVVTRNIDGHASSLSIESVTSDHTGNYTCIANNDAAKASHTAQLLVYVVPKITPFSFQEESSMEGSFARATCLVYQGDLPITLKWLKNDEPLTSEDSGVSVRVIDEYSSILTIERVEQKHSGNYTCLVKNAAASVSHTASLMVHVPPKIVPFSFQEEHLLEGMLVRVSCVVSRGDLPLNITWLKNNMTIPKEQAMVIRDFDEYSSVLSIDPVKVQHNGDYTCLVQNHAGSAMHTATLTVNVPSRWKIVPDDQIAINGRSLTIDCQAEGFPFPKITWKKELGIGITDEGKFITTSPDVHLFKNGSVHFKKISLEDQGYYYCNGNNGIGFVLSRRFFIKVQAPVHFKFSSTNELAKIEGEATLTCEAFGDLPIAFYWFHESREIDPMKDNKFKTIFTNSTKTEPSVLSELKINPVSKEDKGRYICSAHNIHGNASRVIRLVVQEPPSRIKEVAVKNLGNRSVEVSWSKPFNGESAIVNYILQHKRKQDSWSSRAITKTMDALITTTTVKDLQPATIYEFRVTAENGVGRGNFSEIVTIMMGEEAPEGSPLQVEVETVDPQSLRISWKPPKKSLWNGVIRGYYIGYKVHERNEDFTFKSLEVPEDYTDDIIYQLNDLQMYTQYSIIVQAYNNGGRGPSSQEIAVMTSEDTPSKPPQEIRCSSLSSRSIYIIWRSPPTDAIHGILKGYKIYYKPVGDWQKNKMYSNTSLIPKITLNNLEVDTNYSIQVLAFTKLGEGVKSSPVFCKTYEDVPASPEIIKALPISKNSVLVSWKSLRKPSGTVTKYNIYYTTLEDGQEHKDFSNKKLEGVNVVTVETDDKFHEIQGLKENIRYAFWITALSSIGEGPMSTVVTQIPTEHKTPASIASFDDVIKTQWKKDILLSCRMLGNPSPERKWFHRGQLIKENERMFIRFDGTLVIKKSEKEDGGNYTCKVSNSLGQDEIQYSVFVVVPPGVPILDVLSKSLTSIRLRWDLEDDGGSSIQGFSLYYQRQSGKWEKKELSVETETFTLENLACGATYQIYIEAYNTVGIGKPCDIITVTTYGEVFQVPSKEHLIQEGGTFITVHLEAWPSGGCPIQHFVAEYKQLTATEWRLVSNRIKPTQKKLVIPGLTPATWYVLRLTAYTSGEDLNIAEYVFGTLTIVGGTLPPNIHQPEERVVMFYLDPWIFIPIIGLLIIIIIASVIVFIYCKRKTPRQKPPKDWTQYAGTLARARELGVSVESFVPMSKGGANLPMNDYETLRNNGGLNPYSTTHLPLYNSEMTLRRQRTSSNPNRHIQDSFYAPEGNNQRFEANNPFLHGDNQLYNGQDGDTPLGCKAYGMVPLKNEAGEFVHGRNDEYSRGISMESNA